MAFKVEQAWGYFGATALLHDANVTYYGADTTTGHPGDTFGWHAAAGGEIKLPMIAQGDRIGGVFNYGVGATGYQLKNAGSADLFGAGNNVALGLPHRRRLRRHHRCQRNVDRADDVLERRRRLRALLDPAAAHVGLRAIWPDHLRCDGEGLLRSIVRWCCRLWHGSCTSPVASNTGNLKLLAGNSCNPDWSMWTVGTRTIWQPVPGLNLGLDLYYTRVQTAFAGPAFFTGTPSGAAAGRYLHGQRPGHLRRRVPRPAELQRRRLIERPPACCSDENETPGGLPPGVFLCFASSLRRPSRSAIRTS